MNRRLTVLAVLGLSVAAVPTLAGARSHYTGKVPPSVAMEPATVMTAAPQPTRRATVAAPKRTTAKTPAKHAAHKKHHKRKHHAKKSA